VSAGAARIFLPFYPAFNLKGQEKAATKEDKKGCEVGTVHSGLNGKGPVLPRKLKESGKRFLF